MRRRTRAKRARAGQHARNICRGESGRGQRATASNGHAGVREKKSPLYAHLKCADNSRAVALTGDAEAERSDPLSLKDPV